MAKIDFTGETAQFLRHERDPHAFDHGLHVKAAFEILQRHDFLEAAGLYAEALKNMAARAGRPQVYHETITVAFLSLIAERMAERGFEEYDTFIAANPDLLSKSVLERWYAPDRLNSALARKVFLLPEQEAR
jgi:hypothetical protein